MLNHNSYSNSSAIENIRTVAKNTLIDLNWRGIKQRLSQLPKDPDGTYIWWYSRSGQNNKLVHEANSAYLVEDVTYVDGSGHLSIDVMSDKVPELNKLKELSLELPGMSYAGVFFIGPNSYVEDHTDQGTYNFIINIQVPDGASMTIEDKQFQFTNNQIFMFDGDLVHSASNTSNEDWILFALRISKSKFNI